jgi:prolyl-tRNA editing enzyme YbaK/EbsC (Cys-tRNA(Pro) deacylase)
MMARSSISHSSARKPDHVANAGRHRCCLKRVHERTPMVEERGGAMPARSATHEFVFDTHVAYAVVPRRSALTASDDAGEVPTRGRNWAKVLVYVVDGELIEAVLPVASTVNSYRLLDLARGRDLRLANDEELQRLFRTPDVDTMCPSDDLRHQAVFVDVALVEETEIVFDTGGGNDAVRIRWADFAASVRPIVGRFAEPHPDRVGGFRLSYRE